MLIRKLRRELWQQKTQFFAIFAMAFLGLFVFAGLDAEYTGASVSANEYYEETNLADYWVNGACFSEDDRRQLEQADAISQVQRCRVEEGKAPLLSEGEEDIIVFLQFVDGNRISMPQILEGEAFDAEKKGIWIDSYFAKRQHLTVGEELTLEVDGERITQKIKGIIRAPEYVYYTSGKNEMIPDYGGFGYAFLPGSCHPQAGAEQEIYDTLQIDAAETEPSEEGKAQIKESIKEILDMEDLIVTDRTQKESYETFAAEMEQHEMFSFLFPGVFLMIAFLGIITTMVRMTAGQRTVIGTMKALGFSDGVVLRHYISFGIVISLAGAVSGAAAGYFLLPPLLLGSMGQLYLLPEWKVLLSERVFIAILLVTVLSAGVCYFSCRKELGEPPAKALRPKTAKAVKEFWLEKSFFWKNMDFALQWNLRDIRKNKVRTVMGALGAAGCMMLLVCAFGCMDSIAYLPQEMYESLMTGKQTIVLKENTDAFTAGEYARKYSGQEVMVCAAELTGPEKEGSCRLENGSITVVGEGNLVHFLDAFQQEIFPEESDVMLSRKMAELLNAETGDLVRFRILGEDEVKSLRVTKIYRDPNVQGITISKKLFEELEYEFVPTKILTNYTVPQELTEEDAVKSVYHSSQQWEDMLATMEVMSMMVYIFAAAAIILGLVVLYNLSELSFVEKIREYATLKALGTQNRVIRKIIDTQNFIIGSLGVLLGIPAGKCLLDMMWGSMSDSSDMRAVVAVKSYLAAAVVTFAVVWLSCRLMSFRMKKINMIDALKGVE